MNAKPRPLSPHLGIYKWQISSVLSILHRVTGVAISFGLVIFVAWLVFLAGGMNPYNFFVTAYIDLLGTATLYFVIFILAYFGLCFITRLVVQPSSQVVKWILNLLIFVIGAAATVGIFALADKFDIQSLPQIAHWTGVAVMFGITWSFFYHLCNGIRHLCWDAGKFLSIRAMNITGWIVVAISAIMSFGLWVKILGIVTW